LDKQGLKPDEVLPIFRAVLAGWYSTKDMPTNSIEALVDVGFLVYDAGYWNELASIGSESSLEVKHPAEGVSELFLALTARRTVGMDIALDRFNHLIPRSHLLGRHHLSVELEAAYVRGLAGDYAYAREKFRRVAEQADPFDPSDRTQRRARLYQGGMLLMDGAFQESSRLLLETYEVVDPRTTSDWSELVRYRGHAHRFSFALEQAEKLYLRAISSTEIENSPALMGRLQTNLAETYCWSEPHAALRAADGAAQIHATLGNGIELAKCDTARGIALAKIGEFEEAGQVIGRAIHLAEAVGYEGGIAFALQAKVIAKWLAGSYDEAKAACDQLSSIIEEMGTYRHLLAAPRLLIGDTAGFAVSAKRAEWLEDERLKDRIAVYLAPV
jgi:tetratricopeptide (TPR) repeat protein